MQISRMQFAAAAGAEPGLTLEQAFVQHKELVFRAAYRITGNTGDAEDVLQTVFLRLLKQDPLPEVHSLPAYLHRSAVNAALDLLRRGKKAVFLSLDEDQEGKRVEAAAVPAEQPSVDLREWLRLALGKLNPRWAEMFVLRFIEDFSNREIAGMMKTSPAVVAVVLHRTRAQLKKDFKSLNTVARGKR
jgi:RNA polymerase sigma-70 factor (ECF subfamily)